MLDKLLLEDGRLRPFIRFLVSVLGILAVAMVTGLVALTLPVRFVPLPPQLAQIFWFNLLLLPALLAFYALLARLLERRPLGSVGLAFHPRWKNELVMGLAAGTAMILAVAGAEGLLGVAQFSLGSASAGRIALAGALLFLLLAAAAASEELIFRGYPFQRLVDVGGPVFAVIALSVLFGAAHLRNPFHNWISTLNTAVVGVLLAICYLRTRALWLPLGIHFSWNFVQGYGAGLPVSGLSFPEPILQAKVSGPLWLTGGAYGPEGSILTLGVIAVGTVYFFVSRRVFMTTEMQALALGPGNGAETPLSRGTASRSRNASHGAPEASKRG
ncbi:MAG TPA: CPBP family intramembrane glutamic endopeptidase [Terriglobia bacterium]|nr:CPBP family intramembrane glutamic endopeptidase [Terriglobia bacterium]